MPILQGLKRIGDRIPATERELRMSSLGAYNKKPPRKIAGAKNKFADIDYLYLLEPVLHFRPVPSHRGQWQNLSCWFSFWLSSAIAIKPVGTVPSSSLRSSLHSGTLETSPPLAFRPTGFNLFLNDYCNRSITISSVQRRHG